jgi:hypothetical protein
MTVVSDTAEAVNVATTAEWTAGDMKFHFSSHNNIVLDRRLVRIDVQCVDHSIKCPVRANTL